MKHAICLLAAILCGCAVGPTYERPAVEVPADFGEAEPAASAPAVRADWWRLFGDPQLDQLIERGFARNADIRFAAARIDEADAALREVSAALLPQVDLGGRSTRSRVSTVAAVPIPSTVPVYRTEHTITASTAFELDFWGRLRSTAEAARAQALGTRYAADVVRLTLAGAITQTYFALRSLDAQVDVTRETARVRDDTLEIVRVRAKAGLVSDLDINQAEGARADTAAQLKELERQRRVIAHQLAVLAGTLDLKLGAGDVRNLPPPALPPAGLPSALIERRPDIRQVEQQLVAASAQIGVARAQQFPTFALTGALGTQSASLADLVTFPARFWSLGLSAAMPIIDSGRFQARTAQAEARQRQAAASYQRAVETAFREVADALSNLRLTVESEADLRERAERARNTLRIAEARYKSGYSGFLDVLDAQRSTNDALLQLVRNRQALLTYSVDLMRALGGGWTP